MTRNTIAALGGVAVLSVITLFPPFVAWSGQTADIEKLLASADRRRGEALVEACTDCHGRNGYSREGAKPNLAGQLAPYLLKELLDYKSHARADKTMLKQTKRLDRQDLADLAAYYASLPTSPQAGLCPDPPDLITKGDPSRNIAPCVSCHGPQVRGVSPSFPRLAGQKAIYITEELKEFRSGNRNNDHGGIVRAMVKSLTDDEIRTIAKCLEASGK